MNMSGNYLVAVPTSEANSQANMNKYEILPSSSFHNICRTCLMHDELFLIHEVNREDISLIEIIQDWTPLQFTNDDQLPHNMCKDCIKYMYQTYRFMSKCKSSEKVLKNILIKESIKIEVDDSTIELTTVSEQIENTNIKSENDMDSLAGNNDQRMEENFLVKTNDNYSDINYPTEVKSEISNSEEQTEDINLDYNILNKIPSTKNQISKIRVKNIVKLRQMAKAQLVDYSDLPKSHKRIVFRKGPPYICVTCDSSYQTQEELKEHKIETKHKKSLRFTCPHCERKYGDYYYYKEHVRTHTGEKPNKCTICGKCFNSKANLKRHVVTHMDVKPYSCRFCNKGFARIQYLRDHERKHTGEKLLCPFCGKGFNSHSILFNHEKTHKRPSGSVEDPLAKDWLFQCHICDKVLGTDQTLKAHILLHGSRDFTCEICGKTYISENRLQDHIKFTHQENKYSCHLCDKEYKQKSGLVVHLRSHSGQNNYRCETCGKQFALKGSLVQHKRVHTGDTTYQCKECLQICINKRRLEIHLRTHTGEKPFACEFCGKLFAQKSNMQAHSKIHAEEKTHRCKLCEKAFYDARGLKKHMSIHEKNGDVENV